MIRVAFVFEGPSFLGSVNYFRNLFSALALLSERNVRPMLFVGTKVSDKMLQNFRSAEVVHTPLLDEGTFAARVRRRLKRVFSGRDPLLSWLLNRHGVQVLSHYGPLRGASVKTIAWIPDFQHVYLPAFFSDGERAMRDDAFGAIARECDRIVLSSEAAQRDLAAFDANALGKSRVLRFVPEVDTSAPVMALDELQRKYGFRTPFFYVPNQFWIHKNHTLIVDALALLKSRGVDATVVMTGSTEDYRHPQHFSDLMARVQRGGLADSFRVLGLVPYDHLLSLMHHSIAIINPSLFEGWSSTVEEAKALDKTVLLSSLPVHLEQNPAKGIFFDPANPLDLAEKMQAVLERAASEEGAGRAGTGPSTVYKSARIDFAKRYVEIVEECVSGKNRPQR